MAIINKTGIGNGNTIQAEHVTRVIDALSGQSTDTVAVTGSFTGSLMGALTGAATITNGTATLTSATINGTLANGTNVTASGLNSHAEGSNTLATYLASHAEGYNTTASALYSHTEGGNTTTTGNYSHAEGEYGVASGRGAHAEGYNTVASNDYSNAKGIRTLASGRYSLAIGQLTTASADQSFAAGYATIASANGAHAAGLYTTASGQYSRTAGEGTDAEAKGSHAEGLNTITQGPYSHAEGRGTYTSGTSSHAEGRNTTASGDYSHAEGRETVSIGDYSHAEGYQTTASGDYSHAEGIGTVASGSGQLVSGKYNTHGDSTSLFIIGDGTSDGARSDVFKAKTNAIEITGSLSILKAGSALNLVGTDHTYIALYPDGVDAGRKGYIGYASAGDDNLTIYNETGSGGLNFNTPGGTRIYVSASGRVGIGTTLPEAKLHVVGSDTVGLTENVAAKIGPNSGGGSDLLLGSINGQVPFIGAEEAFPLVLQTSGSIRMYISSDGEIAIGSGSGDAIPQGILDIRGGKNGATGRALLITSGSGTGPDTSYAGAIITTLASSHNQHINIIKAGVHPHSLGYVSGTNKFMIAMSTGSDADSTLWSAEAIGAGGLRRGGWVQDTWRNGFNTNSPSHSVHIDQSFGITPTGVDSNQLAYTDISHNAHWGGSNWVTTNSGSISLFRMYGGRGSGQLAPFNSSGFNFYTSTIVSSSAPNTTAPISSRLFISASGYIGIGTETPTHQLTLSTDSAYKPADGVWDFSSDIRLKENIQEANYDTCYDIIKNLPLKRYTWKSDAYTTEQVADRSKLGWIAQDVQTVFPKAVNSSSFSGSGDFHLDDCLTMNADQIYAAMYGTIKKLIVENESLKSELQTIKTHLGL